MKNTFGNSLCLTLFGESHGEMIGATLDGLSPGIKIDEDFIRHQLSLRRPAGAISTARQEADDFKLVSGVFNGYSTGAPLTVLIENTDRHSKDYEATRWLARPGHADLTAYYKYHGYEDYRGGGHFSGRITAPLVAAGAILLSALKEKGICIGTHIKSLSTISDRDFSDLGRDIDALSDRAFAVLDEAREAEMKDAILRAKEEGDSLGGVLETAVIGMPKGVGEPWFDTVEGVISHALFSVPAVKGVSFGDAFSMVSQRGSAYNDDFYISGKEIKTHTNHNAGINGGITNGMPILFSTAIKPTPSIFKEQATVDFQKLEDAALSLKGRHDPAIIHRARVVIDSVTALALSDLLLSRFGTDWFTETD